MGYDKLLSGLVQKPDDEARVLREGACVTLVGRLGIVGAPLPHLDGREVAARTIARAPIGEHSRGMALNQQTRKLRMTVEHELVELKGAIEVVLGSNNVLLNELASEDRKELRRLCGNPKGFDYGVSCRTLQDGDGVRVFGRVYLGASRDNTGDYRQSARSWHLYSAALACMQDKNHPECVIPLVFDDS